MINNESNYIIQQAFNLPIWQARKGTGSFITFDMGEGRPYTKKDGAIDQVGAVHLWIYLCDWTISDSNLLLADSSSDEETIVNALARLNYKKISSVVRSSDSSIIIDFEQNISMQLNANTSLYDKDSDLFILYTPVGNLSYNEKFGFEVESKIDDR